MSDVGYDGYLQRYGKHAPSGALDKPVSKSWLFEVVDSASSKIVESFTLILPPTSISIKEPQRVSITKTFGNAFVDDYGPDNLQITLKGFSGTAHVFPTFKTQGVAGKYSDISGIQQNIRTDRAGSGYNGRDAFYVFRDTIMRYKDKDKWDTKELRVYDLADEQAYKCVLLEFTLDREAGQPINRYPFTISLFVYHRLERATAKPKPITIAANPTAMLNNIDDMMAKIDKVYADVQGVINQVYLIKAKVIELRSRISQYIDQTTRILTSPLDIAKNLIDIAFQTVGIGYDLYRAGKYTLERYMNVEEMILQSLNDGLKIYGFQISQGWQASRTVTLEGSDGIDTSGEKTSRRITEDSYSFSGLDVYTIKGDDTLQRIAQNELGDDSLWPYIASVNSGITGNDSLVPGATLYVPTQVFAQDGANKEQYIFTEDVARDPYGTDIRLDANGDIVIQENGDFSLLSGPDNVRQAVDLKLNTTAGSMVKQSTYGITASAGLAGTTMALRYLKMAIRATLVADARIESITDLIVSVNSDVINMSMNVNLIGTEDSLPVSVVL